MTLSVRTARMGYRGPDYLDISLQGNMRRKEYAGHRDVGLFFAPSPDILYPILSKRKHRGGETEQDWLQYVKDYTREMRASYRTARQAWDTLLGLERVVLLCFCVEPARCHRTLRRHGAGRPRY